MSHFFFVSSLLLLPRSASSGCITRFYAQVLRLGSVGGLSDN